MAHLVTLLLFLFPIYTVFSWVYANDSRRIKVEKWITKIFEQCKYPFQCILEKDNRVFTFVCRPEDIKPVV